MSQQRTGGLEFKRGEQEEEANNMVNEESPFVCGLLNSLKGFEQDLSVAIDQNVLFMQILEERLFQVLLFLGIFRMCRWQIPEEFLLREGAKLNFWNLCVLNQEGDDVLESELINR